jgi:FKBP-type peptidyl-prolyl cis-trans isomerase
LGAPGLATRLLKDSTCLSHIAALSDSCEFLASSLLTLAGTNRRCGNDPNERKTDETKEEEEKTKADKTNRKQKKQKESNETKQEQQNETKTQTTKGTKENRQVTTLSVLHCTLPHSHVHAGKYADS